MRHSGDPRVKYRITICNVNIKTSFFFFVSFDNPDLTGCLHEILQENPTTKKLKLFNDYIEATLMLARAENDIWHNYVN